MKKIVIGIVFVLVFLCAVGGSYMYVKKLDETGGTSGLTGSKKENKEEMKVNEHIVETNRFATIGEWNSFHDGGLLETFPDDDRYHMAKSNESGALFNVIDSAEVYKEYVNRIAYELPKDVDFSKNFVVLVYNEDFKSFNEKADFVIADITHSEDDGTMNIVFRERENPSEYNYWTYNAWYAVINDRSLLRPASNVILELNNPEEIDDI